MTKKATEERPALFTVRADAALWDALDQIQVSRVPVKSRSDIVRDLVLKECERVTKGQRK